MVHVGIEVSGLGDLCGLYGDSVGILGGGYMEDRCA